MMKTFQSKLLSDFSSSIAHGFFTRNGGIGTGLYESLNVSLASNDDKAILAENRRLCTEHLGVAADKLVTLAQCHSDTVITVDNSENLPFQAQADALVTKLPDIALGIQTADCAPILFYCSKSGIIGATHAGWQGALKDIHIRTVEAMKELGAKPENITAAIGPCLHQKSFEVGDEFFNDFINKEANNRHFFTKINGRYHFDNPGFISAGLNNIGVTMTEILPHDTYSEEIDFFSYRRATHRSEQDYGRQLSAIVLRQHLSGKFLK